MPPVSDLNVAGSRDPDPDADYGRERAGGSVQENESQLRARRLTEECDQYHPDREYVGCVNGSCQCWCHQ